MAKRVRFNRLASSQTVFQTHIAEDTRYALLPVFDQPTTITGWTIYDTIKGELIRLPDGGFPGANGFTQAKAWLEQEYYG